MKLNKTDREEFRRRFNILIPQMEKSEIVNHFKRKEYPRQTIYTTINRMQLGRTIDGKKKTRRPTSWTLVRKNQLKRLTNNRKGVISKMYWSKIRCFPYHHQKCRQLSKMNISCYEREKTLKYSEKQAKKANNLY